jgi:hypothetical protein
MVQDENVKNLSNMGTNIKEFRNKYFTVFVTQHLTNQNNLRRHYEQQ